MPESPGPAEPEEGGPVGSLVRLFLGQLAAVLAIAAVIAVVVAAVRGDPEVRTAAPGSAATAASPGASGDSAGPASTPPASPAPSSPAPSSPAPSTPPPSPTPSAPAATSPTSARPKVDVLNQSAGDGAAARVARQLRQAGWRIGRVDDFSGNVSTTTVYWLDRPDRRAARALATQLGGVRVQEGFDTLVEGRLSVVLVEERQP